MVLHNLVPRLSCGGGGERAWYTLFAHAPNSLGNLHATSPALKLRSILLTCWKAALHDYTLFWYSYGRFFKSKTLSLRRWVCTASFEVIGELQRKRLRQSHAAVFSWNPLTRGQFLQAKDWVSSSLLRHRPHTAWSGTGTFYMGEVGIPCGSWCNGADFTEISKFPEILGELSMHKQCVSGSFFSAHA